MDEYHYQILDLGITLSSDSKELLSRFDEDYEWFRVPSLQPGKRVSFFVALESSRGPLFQIVRSGSQQKEDSLSIPIEREDLADHPSPAGWCLQLVLESLFQETEAFLVLHAGVVAHNGSALILAGSPGCGKTTLVLELLKRGFRFMSDDACPLNLKTGRIQPFPRRIRVVQPRRNRNRSKKVEKSAIPLEELPNPETIRPKTIGWLFCLDPGDADSKKHVLRLRFRGRTGNKLLTTLVSLPEVRMERNNMKNREVLIRYPRGKGLTRKIYETLALNEDALCSVYRVNRVQPNFCRKPQITKIPIHQAAFHLLPEMKTNAFESSRGMWAHRLWELSAFLKDASTWRLRVGELTETIDRIVETVRSS